MPEEITYINKVYPCPDHMNSFAVAENMGCHWKIYIQKLLCFCLLYIFIDDI